MWTVRKTQKNIIILNNFYNLWIGSNKTVIKENTDFVLNHTNGSRKEKPREHQTLNKRQQYSIEGRFNEHKRTEHWLG